MKRLSIFVLTFIVVCVMGVSRLAVAAEGSYPNKPVTLIVSFPPGGSSDFFTRSVGNELSKIWNQPVIVENRPGAGGNIGAQIASRASGDGYTLFMSSINTHGINQSLYKNLGFDAVNDFVPISKIATVPNVIVVNPDLPVKSISQLLEYMRANPSKAFFASAGTGTGPHMCSALLKSMAKIQVSHIPYKGSAPALSDVMAGNVPMACDNLPAAISYIKAGKLRALAVTSKARVPELPEIPTMIESGFPDFEMTSWWAIFAPKGTPQDIVSKINVDIVALLNSPQIKESFAKYGATPAPSSQADLTKLVNSEITRWAKVVKESGITAD